MKNKFGKILCIVLLVILISLVLIYILGLKKTKEDKTVQKDDEITTISKRLDIKNTLTSTGEIKSIGTEQLKLNKKLRYKKLLLEKYQKVKKGEKLLEYTNGTYLTAPYDLIINEYNIPEKIRDYCLDTNYIEVINIEKFVVEMEVKETQVKKLEIGQLVEVQVNALENKVYSGKVSKINPIGKYAKTGSTFQVLIEFENDELRNVEVGMSAFCTITTKEVKNVVAVPIDALQREGNKKYVIVKKDDGNKTQYVETGICDSNYVEIINGIKEGDTLIVPKLTSK